MADCANGYNPETNPRGCRYHHQHSTNIFHVPTGEYLDGTDIELTREEPWCPGDTCTGCLPHRTEIGLLCTPCHDKLETALLTIPRHWQELAHHLAPGSGAGQARVSGTPEHPNATNPAAYDHRAAIENILAKWVDQHADDRPGDHRPWNRRYPPRAAAWLHTRLDWATQQPWIRDYHRELRWLASKARATLDPSGQRRLRDIGPCSEEIDPAEDGAPTTCPGRVTALLAPADDTMPASLVCDINPGHTLDSAEWIRAYQRAEKRQERDEAA